MINAPQLLTDLKRRLTALEADLRERISAVPSLEVNLQAEWQSARAANRTAETFESWSDQVITQAGVHWLLSCVFLRFIEDNSLVERPWIGGTPDSGRLNLARDRHEAYFRAHPLESDREYMLACFVEAGKLPGLHTFFDEAHNPAFRLGISGDAAMGLRQFWQQQDPNTGSLLHDFTDATWNTRFLGDLYQDLSEATRKRYALLQTPEFVEEFILDRTLTPAIREFGYRETRMIDPTCGSGHFLLGGFQRIVEEWSRAEPTRNRRDVAQKALDSVCGVDLNPFAVAISRFRLLLAALQASGVHRLSEAPDFQVNVVIGDSLLHGTRFGLTSTTDMFDGAHAFTGTGLEHSYASEDLGEVQRILGRQYHAVVGNPPYITVKDEHLNVEYRRRYASCYRKYSLGAPFTERFFELAITRKNEQPGGFLGLITTNSFMKREFGSKLIEDVLPRLDLTHVIDTSGAHIPGHGTPTVILLGRHQPPLANEVRVAMGIKGEPGTPDDPAQGLVWTAILDQLDHPGSESEFISVGDINRRTLGKHPWSIGGGGASDLKELIETNATSLLSETVSEIGFGCVISGEEGFFLPLRRKPAALAKQMRPLAVGEAIRDGGDSSALELVLYPYDENVNLLPIEESGRHSQWTFRTTLGARRAFGNQSYVEAGRPWWEYHQIPTGRNRIPLSITFPFIATHNHFVLDRGGKVFNRTAPVIKLPVGCTEDEHLQLIGLLNSSVACFWGRQTFFPKGGFADGKWQERLEWDGTKLLSFPLVENRPLELARAIDSLAAEALLIGVKGLFESQRNTIPTRGDLDLARSKSFSLRRKMISLQEELDWQCYELYGLIDVSLQADFAPNMLPEVELGQRAFEIVLARRVAAGIEKTTWFEHHGSMLVTEVPSHWPESYRELVLRRMTLIENDINIGMIERPEYKRRWNSGTWNHQERDALRGWLLDRLESPQYWAVKDKEAPALKSIHRLTDAVRQDSDFMQVAHLYAGHADFDLFALVNDLVAAESVPFLPVLIYSDSGRRKHAQWEDTWTLQRREDAGETIDSIPVPPKYQSKDFLTADAWRLRGGLDVPKERWISYPGCERGVDGSLVIAWAGWDHLKQATAIAGYYLDMKDNEGWTPGRLQALLAGLLDLLPWLDQWHNEVDPAYGERMSNYYRGFVVEEVRTLGLTLDDLRNWAPAKVATKRGRKAKA